MSVLTSPFSRSLSRSFGSCCRGFATLSRAAAKAAAEQFRKRGVLEVSADWSRRAIICERCPMRVIHNKKSYCGNPLLQKIDRDETMEGCGCPCIAKAKRPDEHCPVDLRYRGVIVTSSACNCKWCASPRHETSSTIN